MTQQSDESGVEHTLRFQDGVQALLGVLNDIGGGWPWSYNVITEAAEDALQAALEAIGTTHRDALEYRAVGYDEGDQGDFDRGVVRLNRRDAVRDLTKMCEDADPPYDDGWVEERYVGSWKKSGRR